MPAKSRKQTYTKPELREKIKERVLKSAKGGKSGQWSARKAQLVASEYEKEGGGYKHAGKRTAAQKHLQVWTAERWKTSDDKPARRRGGTTRYLPAKAWDELTPAQKRATNKKKRAGSKKGNQYVANTSAASKARKAAAR